MKIIRTSMDWGRAKVVGTAGSAGGAGGLDGISVDITGIADGDVIVYDSSSGTFIVAPPTGGSPSGPAAGDLDGTYPNPTVVGIDGIPVDFAAPTDGYIVSYDAGLGRLVLVANVAAGYREVLMASGITDPPDPLVSSDGTDWLYGVAA